ncbi:unnamed protein product, partial [Choristocarpus tenellus]
MQKGTGGDDTSVLRAVKVQFDGWNESMDTWVPLDAGRLVRPGTHLPGRGKRSRDQQLGVELEAELEAKVEKIAVPAEAPGPAGSEEEKEEVETKAGQGDGSGRYYLDKEISIKNRRRRMRQREEAATASAAEATARAARAMAAVLSPVSRPAVSLSAISVPITSVPVASVSAASVPRAAVPTASVSAASVPTATVPMASVPATSVPVTQGERLNGETAKAGEELSTLPVSSVKGVTVLSKTPAKLPEMGLLTNLAVLSGVEGLDCETGAGTKAGLSTVTGPVEEPTVFASPGTGAAAGPATGVGADTVTTKEGRREEAHEFVADPPKNDHWIDCSQATGVHHSAVMGSTCYSTCCTATPSATDDNRLQSWVGGATVTASGSVDGSTRINERYVESSFKGSFEPSPKKKPRFSAGEEKLRVKNILQAGRGMLKRAGVAVESSHYGGGGISNSSNGSSEVQGKLEGKVGINA